VEVLSIIVMFLLSLVGYSGGVTGKAGKSVVAQPQVVDLVLILVIWALAIYLRLTTDLNRWFYAVIWLAIGIIVGIAAAWPRKFPQEKKVSKELKAIKRNLLGRLWQSWSGFAKRLGDFQNRIILSLFFFTLVMPIALAVRSFSDPLRIKEYRPISQWLLRHETNTELAQFKEQY
jgi:hypothetical protein